MMKLLQLQIKILCTSRYQNSYQYSFYSNLIDIGARGNYEDSCPCSFYVSFGLAALNFLILLVTKYVWFPKRLKILNQKI